MAGATPITVIGTVGQDAEIRDAGGTQVASFSVAVTDRKKEGDNWVDGDTTWFRISCWRDLAVNAAQSITKGTRVIVTGTLVERPWTDKDGNERSSIEVTAEDIGASIRFATVNVQRAVKNSNQETRGQQRNAQRGGGQQRPAQRQQPQQQDPWASDEDFNNSSVPF